MIDPVYAQNDFYLNASAAAPAGSSVNPNSGLMAGNSSASVVPNLYENGFYPQNYSVISDTAVGTLPNSGYGNAAQMASDSHLNAPALSIEAAPAAEWSQTAGTETYGTGTAALLTTQTQRVCLEDGTEVILEHDAMIPENRALNPSAQFASTNDSSVSAPRTAISTGNSSAVIPVSAAVPDPVLKTAELKPAESLVRTASLTEEQIVSFASEQNDVKRTPAPAENLSTDGYPIVVAENPQIQLAPGEVLISQEDFILEPSDRLLSISLKARLHFFLGCKMLYRNIVKHHFGKKMLTDFLVKFKEAKPHAVVSCDFNIHSLFEQIHVQLLIHGNGSRNLHNTFVN